MASSRHLARVLVLQTLFAYEFHPATLSGQASDPEAVLEYVAREFEGKIEDLSFAYELLNGVLKHQKAIWNLMAKYAPAWPIEKIAPLDRAAMEIGIFEMQYSKDVPPVVAIDEAIELAKTFGNENSQKFVNGVLNAILTASKK
ncbi:MAG: transcription antitermination factor NusB [Patescibacteria group bacterium]